MGSEDPDVDNTDTSPSAPEYTPLRPGSEQTKEADFSNRTQLHYLLRQALVFGAKPDETIWCGDVFLLCTQNPAIWELFWDAADRWVWLDTVNIDRFHGVGELADLLEEIAAAAEEESDSESTEPPTEGFSRGFQ